MVSNITYGVAGELLTLGPSDGRPIGAKITDRVLATDGLTANPTIPNPMSGSVIPGIFRDQFGFPFSFVYSTTVYQYFVTSLPGSLWQNVPTFVRTPFGDYMVLSITISRNRDGHSDVSINGDAGLWNPDGTPRLPLCQ